MNPSLTGIHTPSGTYQTEVTVPNDETNNTSCFCRTIKKICSNATPIIVRCLTSAAVFSSAGTLGGLVGVSQASTASDLLSSDLNSTINTELVDRSTELINHNKDLIIPTIAISNALIGALGYLMYKLVSK